MKGNPAPMVREIARAWGGRLVVNGLLAFEDGGEREEVFCVQDVLVEDVAEGEGEGEERREKKFFWREDVEVWLCAEVLKEVEDKGEGRYGPGYLAGLGREERRAFMRRYEEKIRALRAVRGFRRIEEEKVEQGEGVQVDN
jgi:hypothetical protein